MSDNKLEAIDEALQDITGPSPMGEEIVEGRYFPFYQPIVGLTSGQIEGYEALARFRNSAGQICSAGYMFLDPHADLDFALSLDRHIRLQALRVFAANPKAGCLAINISPGWIDRLSNRGVLPTIRMVEESGLDPARVIIEITESTGDLHKLRKAVNCYHEAGMRVALDDFGVGASQIDRIEALEPDIVKLDMRLFKDAAKGNSISADIALAVTDIATRVGCNVVCEGVETEREFYFGLECGSSHVQGYLFKEALPRIINAKSTIPEVRKLQGNYLKTKSGNLLREMEYKYQLKEAVLQIRTNCAGEKIALDAGKLLKAGVRRYFICDTTGRQISANYEVKPEGIQENPMAVGLNWAHRPYFALFMTLRGTVFHNLYASETYRDVNSHNLCQTYGHFLDDQRILLVDAEVQDSTLYVE